MQGGNFDARFHCPALPDLGRGWGIPVDLKQTVWIDENVRRTIWTNLQIVLLDCMNVISCFGCSCLVGRDATKQEVILTKWKKLPFLLLWNKMDTLDMNIWEARALGEIYKFTWWTSCFRCPCGTGTWTWTPCRPWRWWSRCRPWWPRRERARRRAACSRRRTPWLIQCKVNQFRREVVPSWLPRA